MTLGPGLEQIIRKGDYVMVELNCTPERFESCFSKMEFLTSYGYMKKVAEESGIQTFSYILPDSIYSGDDLSFQGYLQERGVMHSHRGTTKMEKKFEEDFSLMATRKKKKLSSMSIFSEIESIKGAGKKNLIFSGFNTEVDIMFNVMCAADLGFVPVVLSDGVSSPWELRHFNALEAMSRYSYIMDSRDVMEIKGDHL